MVMEIQECLPDPKAMVQSLPHLGQWFSTGRWGRFCSLKDIWQCMETFWGIKTGGVMLTWHLVGRGQGYCSTSYNTQECSPYTRNICLVGWLVSVTSVAWKARPEVWSCNELWSHHFHYSSLGDKAKASFFFFFLKKRYAVCSIVIKLASERTTERET